MATLKIKQIFSVVKSTVSDLLTPPCADEAISRDVFCEFLEGYNRNIDNQTKMTKHILMRIEFLEAQLKNVENQLSCIACNPQRDKYETIN